jgi:hypothetical protein
MAVFLDEDQVGADPIVVAYPHLLLCMGATVLMSDGSLIGAHYTTTHSEDKVGAAMAELIQLTPATMHRLYLTGNVKIHVDQLGGGNYRAKAAAIGYQGDVCIFDTSKFKPTDGTFVKITSLGPGKNCLVEWRLNEEMRYETAMSRETKTWKVGPGATRPVSVIGSNVKSGALLQEAQHLVDIVVKRV